MIFGTNTRLRTPEVGWQADELAHDLTATAKVAVLAPRALARVQRAACGGLRHDRAPSGERVAQRDECHQRRVHAPNSHVSAG